MLRVHLSGFVVFDPVEDSGLQNGVLECSVRYKVGTPYVHLLKYRNLGLQ